MGPDGSVERVKTRCDWSTQKPSTAVIEAITAGKNVHLPIRLYDHIDPEFLDVLVTEGSDTGPSPRRFSRSNASWSLVPYVAVNVGAVSPESGMDIIGNVRLLRQDTDRKHSHIWAQERPWADNRRTSSRDTALNGSVLRSNTAPGVRTA